MLLLLLLLLLASVMAKRVDRNEFGDTTRDDDEYEDLTICCWNGEAMIGRRTRRAEQTMQRLVLVIRNNMKRSKEQVKDRIKDSPMVFRAQIESSRAGQNEYTDEGQTKNNPRKEPGLTGSKEVKLTFVSGVLS